MADIKFYANLDIAGTGDNPTIIRHDVGSGIGFYGAGFGISVAVGQHQESTFVTNSAGTDKGIKLQNTKYTSVSGVAHNGNTAIGTSGMPNYYAPLNVKFSHSEAVRVQNCKMRIFDRNDIAKHASGVNTHIYEVRHPDPLETDILGVGGDILTNRGESDHGWKEYDPVGPGDDAGNSMFDTTFTSSPGVSGTNSVISDKLLTGVVTTSGAAHKSLSHDWYVALSASPDSIGSKTDYGLYFTCEYL